MNPQVYITPDNRKVSGVPRQKARQKILRRYRLLEIDADEGFRRLLAVAARFFKVPIGVTSFMAEERNALWVKHGFEMSNPLHSESLCTYTYFDEKAPSLVFRDMQCIPATINHPHVAGPFGLRFYAGANIFLDNVKVGTFCIADYQPRLDFSAEDEALLVEMAECAAEMIVSQHQRWIQERWYDLLLSCDVLNSLEQPLQSVNANLSQVHNVYSSIRSPHSTAASSSSSISSIGSDSTVSTYPEQVVKNRSYHDDDWCAEEKERMGSEKWKSSFNLEKLQHAVNLLQSNVMQLGEAIALSLKDCMSVPPTSKPPQCEVTVSTRCRSGSENCP